MPSIRHGDDTDDHCSKEQRKDSIISQKQKDPGQDTELTFDVIQKTPHRCATTPGSKNSWRRPKERSPAIETRVPAGYYKKIHVRKRVLECADAKGRWPVAYEVVKYVHRTFSELSSCDSKSAFFASCLRELVGQSSSNGNDRKSCWTQRATPREDGLKRP